MSRISNLITSANDIDVETVHLPQWGVDIEVRGMDGNARARYMKRFAEARESGEAEEIGQIEMELICATAFDPEDHSVAFQPEDIPMLFTKSGAAIGRLATAALRASGLTQDAEKNSQKDSEVTVSGGSTSPSPES